MRSIRFVLAFAPVVLALTLGAGPAWPKWSHDPYENSFVVSNGGSDPEIWDVLADGSGGAFVFFALNNTPDWDVYAQHIVNGNQAWGPAVPVCTATGQQNRAHAVADGQGGLFVCWADGRSPTNFDVYLTRLDANGSVHVGWPVNGLNLCTHAQSAKMEGTPFMVADGSGGVVVAWLLEATVSTDYDVYGARATADHVILWSGPLVTGAGTQFPFGAIPTGAGGAIVGFTDGPFVGHAIRALRCGPAGALEWGGVKDVCFGLTGYSYESIVQDGTGGALFAWEDLRGADHDIYAQRISGTDGTLKPGWLPNGSPVCTATNTQRIPVAVADGNGGVLVAWSDARNGTDFDVYAQHLLPEGGVRQGWDPDGNLVSDGVRDQETSTHGITTDGVGGVIVAWNDERRETAGLDIFASRITGSGVLLPAWNYNGTAVSIAPGIQADPFLTGDGAGGMIAFWQDVRTPGIGSIYVQRVDRFGMLGDAGPVIVQVADVNGDQGGRVRLIWESSYLDADPGYSVDAYWIWRQVPAGVAARALREGARLYDERADIAGGEKWEPRPQRLIRLDPANTVYGWEYVASQPASGFVEYSYTVSTTTDSSESANPYTYFMVQARYAGPGVAFWDSAPDSGYSVDNLGPAAPSPFTAVYAGGQTTLHWGSSPAPDFALYRLHRGSSPGFVPSPANRIAEQSTPDYLDVYGGFYYYKLAAVDVHGNPSPYAVAFPSSTTGVTDAVVPRELTLGGVAPSPMRGGAEVRFGLPRAGHVAVAVFDPGGRRVRELADGRFEAGEHRLPWKGDDARGFELPCGVYFLELRAEGRSLVKRFVKVD